jgi:hypothetical protein
MCQQNTKLLQQCVIVVSINTKADFFGEKYKLSQE